MDGSHKPTSFAADPPAAVSSRAGEAVLPVRPEALLFALSLVLAVCVLYGQGLIPRELVVEAGLLCAAAVALTLRLGAAAKRRAQEISLGLLDDCTGLYNRRGLTHIGDALWSARKNPAAFSVAVFDFSDLVEMHSLYGSRVSRELIVRIVRKLKQAAGSRGFAARIGKTQFALVMPGLGQDRTQEVLRRVLGHPYSVEFDAGDSEIVLVPDVLVAAPRQDTDSVAGLCGTLMGTLARVREDALRRRQYLQRERERHSQPMGMPSQQDSR